MGTATSFVLFLARRRVFGFHVHLSLGLLPGGQVERYDSEAYGRFLKETRLRDLVRNPWDKDYDDDLPPAKDNSDDENESGGSESDGDGSSEEEGEESVSGEVRMQQLLNIQKAKESHGDDGTED